MSILNPPELPSLAKSQIVQMLDAICQSIEPTKTQYNEAKQRYDAIGAFLAEEGSSLSRFAPKVYVQGSWRTRTANRPGNGKHFDLDLVCEFKIIPHLDPKVVKRLVLSRFLSNDRYRASTFEKKRCVQIQYNNDFHMDVMPCVPSQPGWTKTQGVWVPDKKMDQWKPSNPLGFSQFVEVAAAKTPVQRVCLANTIEAKASVEPLPAEQSFTKPALLRIIQILKRHRDEYFRKDQELAPISIIITTLATHSYSQVVEQQPFESAYDLMLAVIAGMLEHIRVTRDAKYWIANPSQPDENFGEKWNDDQQLADKFFTWHHRVMAEIKALAEQEARGIDKIGTLLENSFGTQAANCAIHALSTSVRETTAAGKTQLTGSGLIVPATLGISAVTKVPPHNFYGD